MPTQTLQDMKYIQDIQETGGVGNLNVLLELLLALLQRPSLRLWVLPQLHDPLDGGDDEHVVQLVAVLELARAADAQLLKQVHQFRQDAGGDEGLDRGEHLQGGGGGRAGGQAGKEMDIGKGWKAWLAPRASSCTPGAPPLSLIHI